GDEAVDLAIAEQPFAVSLHQLVGIAAAGADLWDAWTVIRAVLHDGPVRAHLRRIAVERDDDVGDEMDRARPVGARAGANIARQLRDPGTAGCLAEGGVPSAVFGEQCRHAVVIP